MDSICSDAEIRERGVTTILMFLSSFQLGRRVTVQLFSERISRSGSLSAAECSVWSAVRQALSLSGTPLRAQPSLGRRSFSDHEISIELAHSVSYTLSLIFTEKIMVL